MLKLKRALVWQQLDEELESYQTELTGPSLS